MTPDLIAALAPVVDALSRLGVPCSVVGSVASSAHGIARSAIDADLVADLGPGHVDALVAALVDEYYVDDGAVRDAIQRRSMFNVVLLATMLKVNVYLLTARPFDRESFRRRQPGTLAGKPFVLATPEDTVLHKLEWYRAGGCVSDRQWGDIAGVLKVQRDALDAAYMVRWASALGVSDLLQRARAEAGWPAG